MRRAEGGQRRAFLPQYQQFPRPAAVQGRDHHIVDAVGQSGSHLVGQINCLDRSQLDQSHLDFPNHAVGSRVDRNLRVLAVRQGQFDLVARGGIGEKNRLGHDLDRRLVGFLDRHGPEGEMVRHDRERMVNRVHRGRQGHPSRPIIKGNHQIRLKHSIGHTGRVIRNGDGNAGAGLGLDPTRINPINKRHVLALVGVIPIDDGRAVVFGDGHVYVLGQAVGWYGHRHAITHRDHRRLGVIDGLGNLS